MLHLLHHLAWNIDPLVWLLSFLPHPHRCAQAVELYGLDDLAESLGVSVIFGILPPGWWGAFHAFSRTVTMRRGLKSCQFRSVLAHELGHAHHGHGFSPARSKEERMADRFAAQHLIRMDDYAAAVGKHGGDTDAVAAELHVMPWVVREYAQTMNGGLFSRSGVGKFLGVEPVAHSVEAHCQDVMDVTSPVESKVLIIGNNVLR